MTRTYALFKYCLQVWDMVGLFVWYMKSYSKCHTMAMFSIKKFANIKNRTVFVVVCSNSTKLINSLLIIHAVNNIKIFFNAFL